MNITKFCIFILYAVTLLSLLITVDLEQDRFELHRTTDKGILNIYVCVCVYIYIYTYILYIYIYIHIYTIGLP